ncbi:Co2+/Mg2+ efflux protein ApaG [Oxalobacter vibrioformis]|uniref:Protein ApaG n=1 Tax=Oxalobacter vibrioformis TaxID=933080 RepID=A0A9E9M0M7_9BURK|nr:Co2+/Mg2+ efflux protein ApaG [Oxalobacter vibrioformis]WAW11065.1 Co2+/Mg2+ efflux protein ApaG [Oxalobacter vibrioformis]
MSTYDMDISTTSRYLDEPSEPDRSNYVFSYSVSIKNTGQVAAQLIARHWVITDANNHIEEVRGLGVVGRQPLIKPGEVFEYTSGTALPTPQGSMRGAFLCITENAEQFEVSIPEFTLSLPRTLH